MQKSNKTCAGGNAIGSKYISLAVTHTHILSIRHTHTHTHTPDLFKMQVDHDSIFDVF